jgi:16S rRNA (uracil1498-N3)-methyltransferase
MPVFYTSQIDHKQAVLGEEESRHIVKVLRMAGGDPLEIVDGKGNYYKGFISVPDPKACQVRINDVISGYLHRDYHLHIAIAPPKSSDRLEWFLEKATEIGVDEISPVICARSERNRIRHDRSQKILISAMKQSGRALLPRLNSEVSLKDFLNHSTADIKLIAHCKADDNQRITSEPIKDLSWIVMIGPEGDFTPGEIEEAIQLNYREINMGEAVYRTETAGIIACHTISLLYQNKTED